MHAQEGCNTYSVLILKSFMFKTDIDINYVMTCLLNVVLFFFFLLGEKESKLDIVLEHTVSGESPHCLARELKMGGSYSSDYSVSKCLNKAQR